MRDALGPGTILGYCTNVHPGCSLDEIKSQLEKHALAVKQRVSPNEPMGIGLWFPASVAAQLVEDKARRARDLGQWLRDHGLLAYTLNGFPYGDFHSEVVKHAVYKPDWTTAERIEYTLDLVDLLHELLPEGEEGSISTLPIGWDGAVAMGWADVLGHCVDELEALYEQEGRLIHLNLEPEPGCELSTTEEVLMLLVTMGMFAPDKEALHRHLRVCLDVCHQAVMFEKPNRLLEWARDSDFSIGKVQLSSALRVPFRGKSAQEKKAMRADLERFIEPRYLHQTTIGFKDGHKRKAFYDDLPRALKNRKQSGDEWRVHFHLPVYLETIGSLGTTRDHIESFLRELKPEDGIKHFEVETYAWDVLPEQWQVDELADGIARELQWVIETFRKVNPVAAAMEPAT